jgi:hypothetical protein
MFFSGHVPHSLYERGPGLFLLCEDTPSFGGDAVEAAAPLAGLFDPGGLDPSALFEAIEQGIEGIDVKRELAIGPVVDQFAELLAVPPSRLE